MNRTLIRNMARQVDELEALEGIDLSDAAGSFLALGGPYAGAAHIQSWWASVGRAACWQLFRDWVAARMAALDDTTAIAADQLVAEVAEAKAEAALVEEIQSGSSAQLVTE